MSTLVYWIFSRLNQSGKHVNIGCGIQRLRVLTRTTQSDQNSLFNRVWVQFSLRKNQSDKLVHFGEHEQCEHPFVQPDAFRIHGVGQRNESITSALLHRAFSPSNLAKDFTFTMKVVKVCLERAVVSGENSQMAFRAVTSPVHKRWLGLNASRIATITTLCVVGIKCWPQGFLGDDIVAVLWRKCSLSTHK